jgi:hypothetical protein
VFIFLEMEACRQLEVVTLRDMPEPNDWATRGTSVGCFLETRAAEITYLYLRCCTELDRVSGMS